MKSSEEEGTCKSTYMDGMFKTHGKHER